ncbi:Bug family tripartite tricarboxylate transporter substrate binding protein [Rubritepida flocculans]|uniref:Bug family tripartite tricarboxylate transporter substrate binding protein n=1 Tax=Rubritepida flocculans TaxID=182403 RepID=UPI00146B7CE0|nr:tripartite tricarboxylate transporter substrate-binding protein [Rubritepida flocculans]
MIRRIHAALLALMLGAAAAAAAQPQPPAGNPPPAAPPAGAEPIRLLVGFPPGSTVDLLARAVAEGLAQRVMRPVEVENRTGGRGGLAAETLARATPDGNTLGIVPASLLVLDRHLARQLGHDPQAELTPISRLASIPLLVLGPPGAGPRTLSELADLLKARPGSCGTSGAGTVSHLTLELLLRTLNARCDMLHYRGRNGAVAELISGGVQVYVESAVIGLPLVREGRVRPLAVTSRARSPLLPEVPAVGETIPGFEAESWVALMGPRGLPEVLVKRFEAAAIAAVRDPAVAGRLRALAADPVGGTRTELAATIRAQDSIWGPVARAAGVTAD